MILPGKTIGILGGGQLGRMFAIAARRMGYQIHCLDPIVYGPTGQIADVEVNAPYDDVERAVEFARGVDVVTFEFENVPAPTLAAIEKLVPVRPSPFVLETTRHRLREKDFLSSRGFPVAPYRRVDSEASLREALSEWKTGILKTAEFGYDGKGQWKINGSIPDGALRQAGSVPSVLEKIVPFDREISVIVARTAEGETRCFDVFENEHRDHILDVTTVVRADRLGDHPWATRELRDDAQSLARGIATSLDLVGVLCIEMFVVGRQIIVNELAPRPHNSGHVTFDWCATSQFEQQVRAVCGLPLGDTTMLAPCAMVNLLGDVWANGEPKWERALSDPNVKLHLYGKSEPRAGRKMGHITARGPSAAAAKEAVLAARHRLA